jgi:hypothetical protein
MASALAVLAAGSGRAGSAALNKKLFGAGRIRICTAHAPIGLCLSSNPTGSQRVG